MTVNAVTPPGFAQSPISRTLDALSEAMNLALGLGTKEDGELRSEDRITWIPIRRKRRPFRRNVSSGHPIAEKGWLFTVRHVAADFVSVDTLADRLEVALDETLGTDAYDVGDAELAGGTPDAQAFTLTRPVTVWGPVLSKILGTVQIETMTIAVAVTDPADANTSTYAP